MSRVAVSEQVILPPTNNIYTALLAAAVVANVLGLFVVFLKFNAMFGGWPIGM